MTPKPGDFTLGPAKVESVTTSKGVLIIKINTARDKLHIHITPSGLIRMKAYFP